MNTDELRRRLEQIFVHHWDVYSEYSTYLSDKEASVKRFGEELARVTGKRVDLEVPRNINNYYRVQICFTPGMPSDPLDLDFEMIQPAGEVIYLSVLFSPLAPVSEASWHVYRVELNHLILESYDLLDSVWLSRHPELETVALEVVRIGAETNLPVLGWDITRQPADVNWPKPQYAPDHPQLRHFLFMGYSDD